MFKDRLFFIKNADVQELSEDEYSIIRDFLKICDRRLGSLSLYWCSELKERTINAAFVTYKPNCVFLNKPRNPFDLIPKEVKISKRDKLFYENVYKENLMQIVPYIVHEMTHKSQFEAYGKILYAIYNLPGLYNIMLDNIAFENEVTAAIDLRLDPNLYGKPKK